MKKLMLTFTLVMYVLLSHAQAKLDYGELNPDSTNTKWTLIYEDKFTYDNLSQLQANYDLGRERCNRDGIPTWSNVNLDVDNDYLVLTSTRLDATETIDSCDVNFHYEMGEIVSKGSGTIEHPVCTWMDSGYEYGMFEIRCKMPSKSKSKSAWWLHNGTEELDIFEYIRGTGIQDDVFQTNFHDGCGAWDIDDDLGYQLYPEGGICNGKWEIGDEYEICSRLHTFSSDLTKAFHTYTMVWTPTSIAYFMDGRELRTETRFPHKTDWCPLKFILGSGPGELDPGYDESEFIVDYIKVYEQEILDSPYTYNYANGVVSSIPMYNRKKSMALIETTVEDNIFYRKGFKNYMEHYYHGTNGWVASPLPQNSLGDRVAGDIVGGDDAVFYRGANSRLQTYYKSGNNWLHGLIDDDWSAIDKKVSFKCGAIAVTNNNEIFYRGKDDNRMHMFFWNTATSDWEHELLPIGSSGDLVAGDIVAGNNAVFYRGENGRLQTYYKLGSNWLHGLVDDDWTTSDNLVSSTCGAIAINENNNQIFYKGVDGWMSTFYWNNGDWQHGRLSNEEYLVAHRVTGDISVNAKGEVFYRGEDEEIQMYYFNCGYWYHTWVDEQVNNNTGRLMANSTIVASQNSEQIFYRDKAGTIRSYYRVGSLQRDIDLFTDMECGSEFDPLNTTAGHLDRESTIKSDSEIGLKLYPNPTRDEFQVEITNGSNKSLTITLYDSMGRERASQTCNSCTELKFNVEEYESGIYYLGVNGIGNSIYEKIVKL